MDKCTLDHTLKVKAIYWQKNGKKRFDIWQQKEIDDKDNIDVEDVLSYTTDEQGNNSNYKDALINKIIELNSTMKGLTHLEVWGNGQLFNIFRISNSKEAKFNNWNEVIATINK